MHVKEAWRNILSKSISVPMACTRVADECHVKLSISDTDHHTHVPERHSRLKAQVVEELNSQISIASTWKPASNPVRLCYILSYKGPY